jgi:hypothetical protein
MVAAMHRARTLGGLLVLALPVFAHADRISDYDAGLSYDSNLSSGKFREDTRGDFAFAVSSSQGMFSQLTDSDSVTATADLRYQSFNRLSGLDNASLGGTFGFRHKFGVGPLTPWFGASASGARMDFESGVRNGWQYAATARAGQRLNEQWDVSAALHLDRRTQDHPESLVPGIPGSVFDLRSHSVVLNTGYAWSNNLLLSASYVYRTGDVVSTTHPYGGIFFASAAVAADPAFGDNEFAYRLRATSQSLALRASQALNTHSSLNLGLQRQITHGDSGNNYNKTVVDFSYLYSF